MQSLLVCDNPEERPFLTLALQRAGLTLMAERELGLALGRWSQQPADMILLAGGEPIEQLANQVREVRRMSPVPVLVIRDALQESPYADLLEAGADRVLIRPYSSRLLVVEIRALLRRSGGVPLFSLPTLSLGGLTLDPGTRMVEVGSRAPVQLTQLEFRLLYTLMLNRGQILPADSIVEQVWGYAGEGHRDLVRGLINRLRAKIEPERQTPRYVLTVAGVGYRFAAEEAGSEDSTDVGTADSPPAPDD